MDPEDSLLDMVNNIEPLYNDKEALFDKWMEQGDAWSDIKALRNAYYLANHFAAYLKEDKDYNLRYSRKAVIEAAKEMVQEFKENREQRLEYRIKEVAVSPTPQERIMDAGAIEHAKKYELLARKVGIDDLKDLIPASEDRIRTALARGDDSLNSIPLKKWDQAGTRINYPGLSLSEKVSLLKHVATWHYA